MGVGAGGAVYGLGKDNRRGHTLLLRLVSYCEPSSLLDCTEKEFYLPLKMTSERASENIYHVCHNPTPSLGFPTARILRRPQ